MTLDHSQDGAVTVNMKDCIDKMINKFPQGTEVCVVSSVALQALLNNDPTSLKLGPECVKVFHMWLSHVKYLFRID